MADRGLLGDTKSLSQPLGLSGPVVASVSGHRRRQLVETAPPGRESVTKERNLVVGTSECVASAVLGLVRVVIHSPEQTGHASPAQPPLLENSTDPPGSNPAPV